jgi:Flp pilus assembly protein CpaB
MTGSGTGPLSRLFGGKRAATSLMVLGAVMAAVAFFVVLAVARQTQADAAQAVRQVYVVTAVKDIAQFTPIRADSVAIRAFPAAFAPPGALTKVEDVEGKYATTNIVRDQIVLEAQASATRRTSNLSASVPPGKVAFWMPLPDLLSSSGGLQPGDRVDVLLSLTMTVANQRGLGGVGPQEITGVSTQSTLQNVEVFFVGASNSADSVGDPQPAAPAASGGVTASRQVSKVVAFVLDPQDAILAKWVKDSGGTIDLVLRSDLSDAVTQTESVNADVVIDRYKFRVPEQWSITKR